MYYKIGYTTDLNKRIKVYNTGNANKIYFDYIIKIDDPTIDKCMKKTLQNQEYIKNKEFYKISLNGATRIAKKCEPLLKKISCGYCLKSHSFNTIAAHKCKIH